MAKLKVWFDKEGDFLEIRSSDAKGTFREISDDVFERVDSRGNITGFAIFNVAKKALKNIPIELPCELRMEPVEAA